MATTSSNKIMISIPRTKVSSKKCIFGCRRVEQKLTIIPATTVVDVLRQKRLFIGRDSMCCTSHLTEYKVLKQEDLNKYLQFLITNIINQT